MTKFRTEVEVPEFKKKMGYRRQSLMIGSCFAENIGDYLHERCLPIQLNPFGILYNPLSIANCLKLVINRKIFQEDDLFNYKGIFHSFSHHSRFSGGDPALMLAQMNGEAASAFQNLKDASHLFITFGTSWVFKHKDSEEVISNCHKLPASVFNHSRLTTEQITTSWIPLIEQLKVINPLLHLVFTVSPIRHLKDGAHENQLSKSTLLLAIDELLQKFGGDQISYFPSYEIVMDELRDYRFYATDMTHLSELSVNFIREKFISAIMDQEAGTISTQTGKLLQSLNHKPFNPKEEGYLSFLKTAFIRLQQLQNTYPFVDFRNINEKFHEKIIN